MQRLFIFLLFPVLLQAQSFRASLQRANSLYFHNSLFVFGYAQNKMEAAFKIYKLSNNLGHADSLSVNLGKEKAESFLEISADTLHGHLDFYFQKVNSKNHASLIRLDDSLKIIARSDNFDVTKINGLSSFEDEKYVSGNSLYLVRTSEDSLGKQFYLDRFVVSDFKKPYEYTSKWQFPFEKRHIKTAHVFYADTLVALIYVHVLTGEKTGQWILKLNSKTGELIKGTKLNAKGDKRHYLFSHYNYDRKTKSLLAAGTIYTPQQINFETGVFNFNGLAKQCTFFFVAIDSLGEVQQREEKNFPLAIPPNPKSKQAFFYHPKIREIKKTPESEYKIYCDLYKSSAQDLVFLYETGFSFKLSLSEMGADIAADKLFMNLSTLPNFLTADPKDINGKFELKSIREFDRMLYSKPIADVENYFGKDDLGNPKWILNKTDVKTGNKTYYLVKVGQKNALEHKVLLENSKYNHPFIYRLSNEKLLLFNTAADNSGFEVMVSGW